MNPLIFGPPPTKTMSGAIVLSHAVKIVARLATMCTPCRGLEIVSYRSVVVLE